MTTPKLDRVLIVDDFEIARRFLKNSLNRMGYTAIDEAIDGEDGLKKIRTSYAEKRPYSIVFSDLNMPKKSGIELLAACRNDAITRDTPFMMISAETEQEIVNEAMRLGALDYIIKPYTSETIEAKLKDLFSPKKGKKKNKDAA